MKSLAKDFRGLHREMESWSNRSIRFSSDVGAWLRIWVTTEVRLGIGEHLQPTTAY